jgi:hypothetical protein
MANNVIFQTIPRLLDIDAAAAYLGLSPKTLRNRLGRKAENPFPVKPKRHGRKVVFDVRDLDKFADSLPYENYANDG